MLRKLKFLVLLIIFSLSAASATAPDIGDNSLFACQEVRESNDPDLCSGTLIWLSDQNGNDKASISIKARKTKRLLKKWVKFFNKQAKKAGDDEELVASFEAKAQNALQSREDITNCINHSDTCADDIPLLPTLEDACSLVGDPLNFLLPGQSKTIVNGAICSEQTSSPVLAVTESGGIVCTGTLIGEAVVITAGHCIVKSCDVLGAQTSDGSQSIGVQDCIIHPGFGKSQKNDVALLFLENDFDSTVPKVKIAQLQPSVGDTVAFAGYGINEVDDFNLRATFNKLSKVREEVLNIAYKQGDVDEGTTCNGDSGGGLFVFEDSEWKTIGTLSDGTALRCALPGTKPKNDVSRWANLSSESNLNFIRDNTDGILD